MSIKLNENAYRELKTAIRDYKTKGRVEKFLTRIQEDAYQQGYIDCYNVTNNKIKQVVANALNGPAPEPEDAVNEAPLRT